MSLNRLRNATRQLGFQLVFGFCICFVASAAILFTVTYTLFSNSLKQRDHSVLEAKASEYAAIFKKNGVVALQNSLRQGQHGLLLRFESHGKTTYFHLPKSVHLRARDLIDELQSFKGKWNQLIRSDDDESFDVLTVRPGNGAKLQIGSSIDARDDALERLLHTFIVALILTLAIGAILGFLVANRALFPLRELAQTIRAIREGNIDARVPHRKSNDELDVLVGLFNEMLNRIQTLIRGFQDTLDNLSHELKTPMTRLRATAEIALNSPPDAALYHEALVDCLEQCSEILLLVNLLMDISEADTGALQLEITRSKVSELLLEVVDLYEMVAEEKDISIKVTAAPELEIRGDRLRLKRAIANLVDNAIKYSPRGGTVVIVATKSQNATMILVRDTGCGIRDEDLPKVWDRLYRGDHSRSSPGLGLGLSFVRSILQAHGGSVAIDSKWGNGCSVKLNVPDNNVI